MKKRFVFPILLVIQIVLVQVLACFPDTVERYYSTNFYQSLSLFSRFLIGWIPFSVGDVIYLCLLVVGFRWIYVKKHRFLKNWKQNSLEIIRLITLLYFLFHVSWGLNYYRKPLNEKLNVKNEYSFKQLQEFTKRMVLKTNSIQFRLMHNKSQAVIFPYTEKELMHMASDGYTRLTLHLPGFNYVQPSIKASLFSYPLSYMGFGGYLNPFTNEAQINTLKPKFSTPQTICHEMAHQLGYASESECNFLGFLAAWHHEDLYFKYSASTFVLHYCLYHLELMQKGSSECFRKQLNQGVLQNFNENKLFWQQHETIVNDFFVYFYDSFLKLNKQKDGIESYSKFMSLLINYNLKYSL